MKARVPTPSWWSKVVYCACPRRSCMNTFFVRPSDHGGFSEEPPWRTCPKCGDSCWFEARGDYYEECLPKGCPAAHGDGSRWDEI